MLSGRCAVVVQVLRDFRVDRLVATSPDRITRRTGCFGHTSATEAACAMAAEDLR